MSDGNGHLPSGWFQATGEDLFEFLRGISYQKADVLTAPSDDSVIILRAGNLQDGRIVFDDLVHVPESYVRDEQRIRKGDLIIAMSSGSASVVGKVAVADKDMPRVSFGAFCGLLRPRTQEYSHWLSEFFQTKDYRDLISSLAAGININNLRREHLYDLSIPVPPISEMQRLEKKIESLQERSRRAREALSEVGPLLEQFRQSVLAAAFHGDLTADWRAAHPNVEPASELLCHIRAERRRRWEQAELTKYEAKRPKPPKNWQDKYEEPEPVDYSNLPRLPEGWQWSNFDEVSLIDGGLTKHEAKRSKAAIFVPLISVAAVQHGYIDPTQVSAIGLLPTDGNKGKLEKDDLLVVEGNGSLEHIGRAALWDGSIDNARHQNHLIRVRPVLLDPRFSLHWLGSPRGRTNLVAEATSAAGLYNLSLGKVGRVHIPIPPLDEQTEIVKQLDAARTALRAIVDLQRAAVNDLNQLDQAILAKAFRGELVPQDPSDEPASALLARIREQRVQQAEAAKGTKKTTNIQRRGAMRKKLSGLLSQHRPLVEVLTTKGKPMSPEQLLTESGYDDDSIEDFYSALRAEIVRGRIRENRLTERDVLLEAVKQ